jgi:hypothetical protein
MMDDMVEPRRPARPWHEHVGIEALGETRRPHRTALQ